MDEEIKQMSLEERIEKLFESGWVNEFNYLENQLQEARCLVSILQQELDQYKNNWEELKEDITHLLDIIKRNEENIKIFQDEWIAIKSLENKMKELEEGKNGR